MRIVECVPNFSEGRKKDVIEAIRNAAERVEGVTILDCENDPNHNRMVLTFVGAPQAVKTAALQASEQAIKLIDLRTHKGQHPRMGAVDVVPFVPLREISMDECVHLANEFAVEYSKRFQVPVFLYEFAARRPDRKDLAKIREGQFEVLRELIGKDHSKDPDYGPKTIHATAGVTAVGARPILIAYNVNLATNDLSIAKKIAHLVRGRDGGLPAVKALGFELRDRSIVQVSMNLTDYKISSIKTAFDAVSKHASELGVSVLESEIVGLVPLDALLETATSYLKLSTFNPNQVIENRLFTIASSVTESPRQAQTQSLPDFSKMTLVDFADSVASKEPTPGGGTVSAYVGVLAASLVIMVCRLTIGKKGYESSFDRANEILTLAEKSKVKLQELANEDSRAYSNVSKALTLPKSTDSERYERKKMIDAALKDATEVPAETMLECINVSEFAAEIWHIGNKNASSDADTAAELARAAARGAWSNVKINLDALSSDVQFAQSMKSRLLNAAEKLKQ
ncbi:MAG: glutamate formimidoyltransferase [archaeon]|nr:glutamate formimidoyltransferase [archaeon]